MKYGIYNTNESPAPLADYVDGSHIVVLRTPANYISTAISLEDLGWEVRDCIKIGSSDNTLQVGLFRKPFAGSIANNVLENGCGGLNIDATRIKGGGTLDNWKPSTFSNRNGSGLSKSHIAGSKDKTTEENDEKMRESQLASIEKMNQDGRFPANLIFSHSESCERKGNKIVKGNGHVPKKGKGNPFGGTNDVPQEESYFKEEIVADYDCEPDCPIHKLDLQSGITKSSKPKKSDERIENNNQVYGKGLGVHNPQNSHKDSGGASRFFFTYKNEEELLRYLETLIKC